MDPGGQQGVGIVRRAHQVGLDRRAQPAGQAPSGEIEHTAQHRIGAACILGSDLDPTTGRQRHRDLGQPVCRADGISVERQVGQVERDPDVRGDEIIEVPLGVGDVLVFSHRLPHGTLRNLSGHPRAVFYLQMFPAGTPEQAAANLADTKPGSPRRGGGGAWA